MMLGTSRGVLLCALVAACGTGDTRVDPGDLALRDLLGVSPDVASHWNADERASARKVLTDALHAPAAPADVADGSIVDRLAALDARRADAGDDALGLVVLDATKATPVTTDLSDAATPLALTIDDTWHALPVQPDRGLGVLSTFGIDAGHGAGPLKIVPAARLPVIAAYQRGTLVVNPVVIASLEPTSAGLNSTTGVIEAARPVTTTHPQRPQTSRTAAPDLGNPYSFFGSIEECAAAQRTRCEACLPSSSCVPVTNSSDGNAECTTLAANGGRGYYLLCINAALSITSVIDCAKTKADGCARVTGAADSLDQLDANADFLDDMTCNGELDSCLASIFGTPSGSFPGPGTDAGTSTEPPRSTNVSCGNSCDNNNCQASPSCNCSGPSCGNSLSCDSTCASSNNQSGCGGNCDSCDSSSSSSGGGGGGCSGDSSSSSGGGGGGCSSSSSSSGGSSNCGGCSSSSSSSSGGSSGCGDCSSSSSSSSGGDSCGGSSCGGSSSSSSSSSSCGGSGGGKCGVARGEPNAAFALFLSIGWGLLPVPFAARARRKARRAKQEVQP
jgi:hypothetical protein